MPIRMNKTGYRYGRLLVTRISHVINGVAHWHVQCDCGKDKIVLGSNLRAGKTKSCGTCNYPRHITHGMTKTSIYKRWSEMKRRCLNPKVQSYKYYGGRGIKVCKRWMKFENFYKDMGSIPEGYTIERINNDGNYEPDNCKWATFKEQHNNSRHNVILKYKGISMTMVQWAEKLGISRACLWDRIHRNLPLEAIFSSRKFRACEARDIEYNLVS